MDMWVFGYGSLLWNPGFEYDQTRLARLNGYRRSFCMRSIHHRGTVEDPGLVLALDEQAEAHCDGLAFRVRDGHQDQTLAYLRERELISSAYVEKTVTLVTEDGDIPALVYVIDEDHDQYCGDLPLSAQAEIIAHAVGGRGPNSEYLWNTVDHLNHLGITDTDLQWLSDQVKALLDNGLAQ